MSENKQKIPFWQNTLFISFVLVLLTGVFLFIYLTEKADHKSKEVYQEGKEVLSKAKESIVQIASKFKEGEITTHFRQDWISIKASNKLEVASMESVESFEKKDEKNIFWGMLYLGTTVSKVRIPAVYRYHIFLDEEWYLEKRNNVCLVVAPKIYATLPVGFNTNLMEKETDAGWLRFNAQNNLEQLEKDISSRLILKAKENIIFIRDSARKSISEFIKQWLLKEDHWKKDAFSAIVVKFSDEVSLDQLKQNKEVLIEPTLKLSESIHE